tara:strand:+ start:4293 stop:5081 length:789 start_codon:yes stop_codon:yes gene_type:complete
MTYPHWRQKEPPQPILMEIHGNGYEAVPSRIKRFRHDHPYGCIKTAVEQIPGQDRVVAVTQVFSDPNVTGEQILLATGTAVEERSDRGVNSTSCEENAETSSIGRALGIAGYDAANSVATAEEVGAAIAKQDTKPAAKRKAAPKKAAANREQGDGELEVATFTVTAVEPKLKRDGTPVESKSGNPCMAIHTAEGVILETFLPKFFNLAEEAMQFGQAVTAGYVHDPKWKSNSLEKIELAPGEPVDVPEPADTPEVSEEEIPF